MTRLGCPYRRCRAKMLVKAAESLTKLKLRIGRMTTCAISGCCRCQIHLHFLAVSPTNLFESSISQRESDSRDKPDLKRRGHTDHKGSSLTSNAPSLSFLLRSKQAKGDTARGPGFGSLQGRFYVRTSHVPCLPSLCSVLPSDSPHPQPQPLRHLY